MFIIELLYKADLAQIDAHMGAHVVFLKKYYAAGNFLVSGRKIPRDGGIILAVGPSWRDIDAIIEEDPFCKNGLADFRIIVNKAESKFLVPEYKQADYLLMVEGSLPAAEKNSILKKVKEVTTA